jgi:dTDP-glucose 4,6-dehydratase
MRFKRILVTGGAGFMGSAFIRFLLRESACARLVNFDLLTYAGDLKNLSEVGQDPRYRFVQGNILDETLVAQICREESIEAIVHFAAESHVDRSITGPKAFLETNVQGTFALLQVVRKLPHLHFHQISTDEVFGSLSDEGLFHEESPYLPNSPYSASKAAADHFVRSFAHTFHLSTTISHSSNNYGPYQYPEKFIPCMILGCIEKKPLPVYGNGLNVRDWLFVEDHAEAVWKILENGKRGEVYNIGGSSEKKNLDLLHLIISEVAEQTGEEVEALRSLITFVKDRPGHDFRYALDISKIQKELGWKPRYSLEAGLKKTVEWYLEKKAGLCV